MLERMGVEPQLFADNLKLSAKDRSSELHRACQATVAFTEAVGQECAPSKCALGSTDPVVRADMARWVIGSGRWGVQRDVRDLGGLA